MDRYPTGAVVVNRSTGQKMTVESYPMLFGKWTGGYNCVWFEPDVADGCEYPRRKTFTANQIGPAE